MPALPLQSYELFRTRDADEAREQVGRVFCSHRLRVAGRTGLDARQHAARLRTVTLSYLDYASEVRINPGCLGDFFLVQIPLAGVADTVIGHRRVLSTPSMAVLLPPDEPIAMHWKEGSPHLIVRIEQTALDSSLATLAGRPLRRTPRFDVALDLSTRAARSWLGILGLVRAELEGDGSLLRYPLAVQQAEQLLITGLLLATVHELSDELMDDGGAACPPAYVRRAVDLIEAHAAEPLTVAEIAEAVSVSVRMLQQGFQRHLGTTPMARLRDARMTRVHRDLLAADPALGGNVTEVAHRWGFVHMGRFGQAYRAEYGEPPSATLRRGLAS